MRQQRKQHASAPAAKLPSPRPHNIRRIAVLHNIRSIYNVGAIFRTCDAFGISEVYCSGHTPVPVDILGRVRRDFTKTALGSEKGIMWHRRAHIVPIIRKLQREGVFVTALEQDDDARDLVVNVRARIPERYAQAIVVGNEVRGLSRAARSAADRIVAIPMQGKKESLNVSVAFGIAAFALFAEREHV